jgi:hypothetical protein
MEQAHRWLTVRLVPLPFPPDLDEHEQISGASDISGETPPSQGLGCGRHYVRIWRWELVSQSPHLESLRFHH